MNTQTSLVAEQIRLQQWADQIRDCQNRPSDMKVDAWCQEHGYSRYNRDKQKYKSGKIS